jgi:hypothetical protein
MSVKSNKGKASGYNAASPRHTSREFQSLMPAGHLATATLILTPKLIHRFGAVFRSELRVESSLLSISDLYQEALSRSLLPVTKSKSVPDFEVRVKNGILAYSKQYDEILYECERILGASRFKLEYVKQIAEIYKELRELPFASHELIDLFRRHVACGKNAAAGYEELFKNNSNKLYAVDLLLRTTNYGLTVLVLLFNGTLAGSLWIMTELQRLTSDALREMESMPEIHTKTGQLSGSLVFAEGELDLTPETRKPR